MSAAGRAMLVGILLVLPARVGRADGVPEFPEPSPEEGDCGSAALYTLLRIAGRPVDLRTVLATLPARDPRGYSLGELQACARRLGVALEAVRCRGPSDRSPDRPLLAYLRRGEHGHFVVLRGVGHTGRLVQVFDGPLAPLVVDADLLYGHPEWTGIALAPPPPRRFAWIAAGFVALAASVSWWAVARRRHQRHAPWSALRTPVARAGGLRLP